MTIRFRILALLSLLSLLCIGTTWYFDRLHEDEETFTRQQRVNALSSRLQRLIGATTRPASRYLQDFSAHSGMVEFLSKPDPAWAEKNLKDMMDVYHFDAVWVLDAAGAVVYGRNRSGDPASGTLPLPAEDLSVILKRNDRFEFHEFIGGTLHHMEGRPVLAAAVRPQTPLGWLIVAQRWDIPMLHDLAETAEGSIALTGSSHTSAVRSETEMEAWLPLLDQRGHAIAGLDYHVIDPLMENPAMEKIELTLFIYNGVGSVVLAAVLMHWWILRPFSLVQSSLMARDPAPLAPLLNQRHEFGQMARVVQSSMRDREQLLQSHEDRMRLGRELHDGVIQSVYGTGMALSRVQSLMNRDLPAAQELLDETKAELNRIILDLRRHVEKVDPMPLDSSFGAAVVQLIRQFQGTGSVEAKLEIDEELVARHAMLQRGQVLQFVREAVSNAVRHGHPASISISWRATAEGSTLVIADDGLGFDPATVQPGGHGLGNLSERAVSLGGRLEVDSRPDKGTRISLKLPNPAISV